MEQIVESVRANRTKTERRQHEEKFKRDHLNTQLTQLIDKARQYAKVLKDFQEVIHCKFISRHFLSLFFQAIRENELLTSKSK